jgi:hypothetical protein
MKILKTSAMDTTESTALAIIAPGSEGLGPKTLGSNDPHLHAAKVRSELFQLTKRGAYISPKVRKSTVKTITSGLRARGPVPKEQVVESNPFPGRNDPCPCGSGKKFKKCCYKDSGRN